MVKISFRGLLIVDLKSWESILFSPQEFSLSSTVLPHVALLPHVAPQGFSLGPHFSYSVLEKTSQHRNDQTYIPKRNGNHLFAKILFILCIPKFSMAKHVHYKS